MNVNIALNTIIYIMVFLFPGIIFRQVFIYSKYKRQYSFSSALEILVWNILLSIGLLVVYGGIVSFLRKNNYIPKQLEKYFANYDNVIDILLSIYENKFPSFLSTHDNFIKVIGSLALLYSLSFCLSILLRILIRGLGLDKRFEVFSFISPWYDIASSIKRNNVDAKFGDFFKTYTDLKLKNGELVTGEFFKFLFDKDGNICAVAIKKAKRFYRLNKKTDPEKVDQIVASANSKDARISIHDNNEYQLVYKKPIFGAIFSLPFSEIENISFRFVKISNITEFLHKRLKVMRVIVGWACIVPALLNIFFDFGLYDHSSVFKRLLFSIFALGLVDLIFALIESFLAGTKRGDLILYFWLITWFLIPVLYVFSLINGWRALVLFTLVFIVGVVITAALSPNKEVTRSPNKN